MEAADVAVIEPPRRWPRPHLAGLWHNRELIEFLIWRNIKVRYRQTIVGFGWAIAHPLITMAVFTIVFGKLARLPSSNLPYPVFVLAGLMPWLYFSNALSLTSQSVSTNVALITKVYFPRILLPISTVLTPLIDLGIALVLLLGAMFVYGVPIQGKILLLPVLVVALVLTAFSVAVWLSALNVRYRDIGFLIPFLIQIWLFLTPVVYPGSLVPPGALRYLYAMNPMVGIVESFRWTLVDAAAPTSFIGPSTAVVVLLLITGWIYFLRTEQTFADVV